MQDPRGILSTPNTASESMREPVQLYTFILSHYSEKVRWLLDASHTEYREMALTPFLHIPRTLWLGGGACHQRSDLEGGSHQYSGQRPDFEMAGSQPCALQTVAGGTRRTREDSGH
jgi:hypothetical protein